MQLYYNMGIDRDGINSMAGQRGLPGAYDKQIESFVCGSTSTMTMPFLNIHKFIHFQCTTENTGTYHYFRFFCFSTYIDMVSAKQTLKLAVRCSFKIKLDQNTRQLTVSISGKKRFCLEAHHKKKTHKAQFNVMTS